jgi:glycosyltransferase involved in cell wall biosynthesis
MWRGRKLSVVIPCYNEAEGLRILLPSLPASVDEIVVVDNGSTDETAAVAAAAGARVVSETRRGYGRAYKTGFHAATGELIAALDGDGTYHPFAIEYFLDILTEDDLVFISSRRVPADAWRSPGNAARYIGGLLFNWAALFTDALRFRDVLSGMWVFERKALEPLNVVADDFYFSQEIKLEAFRRWGRRAREIPLHFYFGARRGTSKVSVLRNGLGGLTYFAVRRLRKMTRSWPRAPFAAW